MTRATDTHWLPHQSAFDALRRSLVSIKLVEQEAASGNAIALGLSLHLKKPTFVATLLVFSDVLAVLSNLSRCFQSNFLILLSVENLFSDCKAELSELKDHSLQGGYTKEIGDVLVSLGISDPFDGESFVPQVQAYIGNLIANLENRFPQLHSISLLGYLDPRNVHLANAAIISELADQFLLDAIQLWSEYLSYKSFTKHIHMPSGLTPVEAITNAIFGPSRDTVSALFPKILDFLAKLTVLPATSAQVERVFSSNKRIKQRSAIAST